jgi:hypothetical protein
MPSPWKPTYSHNATFCSIFPTWWWLSLCVTPSCCYAHAAYPLAHHVSPCTSGFCLSEIMSFLCMSLCVMHCSCIAMPLHPPKSCGMLSAHLYFFRGRLYANNFVLFISWNFHCHGKKSAVTRKKFSNENILLRDQRIFPAVTRKYTKLFSFFPRLPSGPSH